MKIRLIYPEVKIVHAQTVINWAMDEVINNAGCPDNLAPETQETLRNIREDASLALDMLEDAGVVTSSGPWF